jgi:hypothetical protein
MPFSVGGCDAFILAADRQLRDARGFGRATAVVAHIAAFQCAIGAPLDWRTNCVRAGVVRPDRIPIAATSGDRNFTECV